MCVFWTVFKNCNWLKIKKCKYLYPLITFSYIIMLLLEKIQIQISQLTLRYTMEDGKFGVYFLIVLYLIINYKGFIDFVNKNLI